MKGNDVSLIIRLSDDTMIIIRKQREKDMNLNKEISFRLEKEGTIKGR